MTGIFTRNFDREVAPVDMPVGAHDAARDTATPALKPEEIDALVVRARADGFEAGHAAGAAEALEAERAGRAALTDEALVALSETFGDLAARDEKLRTEVELEVAELILGIGERILPDLLDTFMPDLLLARIRAGLHMASGTGRVSIRVPADLQESLSPRIRALVDHLGNGSLDFRTIADSRIEDGTIRVDWQNGFMEYDPAMAGLEAMETLREAIDELRSQLGDLS